MQNHPLNNLSLYVDSTVSSLARSLSSFKLIESNPSATIADNNSTHKIIFSANGQKNMAVFVMKNDTLYLLRYFAPAETYSIYLPMVQKMLDSFEISNIGSKSNNTASGISTNLNQRFLTYQNSTYGIRIQYPASWEKEQPYNVGTIVRFRSPLNSVFSIWIKLLPVTTTLSSDTAALISILKNQSSFDGFQLVNSNLIDIQGSPASKIVFSAKIRQFDIQGMDIITIKGNKEYGMVYTADKNQYGSNLPIIQRMVDSFVITK
jgi:hypothetical protein